MEEMAPTAAVQQKVSQEETSQQLAKAHMFRPPMNERETTPANVIQRGSDFESPSMEDLKTNIVMDEEEIDVHLPASSLEDDGVSFQNENGAIESEEEVEAHLPDDDTLEDDGKSFLEEDHDEIERSEMPGH